ncbi:hypothetical protein [Ruegeria arenilitoris]|uniref:hypothetical protein n=1 Tax=Ruegeria arenilitoris TaxID=1173585 RepID=UPI00147A0706|nr:hypothetical protein [Ruegeria arenilitoris]
MNFAQEVPLEPGGLQMRFGVAERLEYGRNLALDVPEEGNGFIASTILSFGLSSETRTQTLELDVVTGLRLQDLPNNSDTFNVGDTRLDFGYTRDAANSGLALDAEYLRFDIGFLRSLTDFEDEDGFITLPADFSSLTGDGTRSDYALGFAFDGGRENLIGYNLGLFASGINYSESGDAEFDDSDTIIGEAGLTFALSPVTSTSLTYTKEKFEEDDIDQTVRDTDTIAFGVSHESSDRTRFDATIGYTDVTERREVSGDRDESGVVGNLGVFHDVANGTVFGEYDSSLNASGRLDRLIVGRTLPIPDGDFAFSLGAAHRPDGSVDPIGALLFDRDFGPNYLRIRISRDILADTDDEYTVSNVVDLGYLWRLTPVSQFGLRATYAITEETVTEPRTELGFFSAVYSHELTDDWRFNAGFDYRVSEDDAGRATSPQVFAAIGKEFFWRR